MSQAAAVTYARAAGAGLPGHAVGLIRLERPDNRNSMTAELLDAFAAAIAAARADDGIRCLVVTGSGHSFSTGADFKGAIQRGADELPAAERSFAMYAPFLAVLEVAVPVVAALNGHAIGGGFGLALACDVRIASRQGKYGANFCRLGLSPGMGISYLLPRIVGASRAAELIFAGELIDGERAAAIGLCSEAVDAAEVLPRALALAARIAANAPLAVRLSKQLLRDGLGWDVVGHARREAAAQATTVASADAAEGIAALLGKREPIFRGA
jgi:enoyl-CoA hydratase/carnithine racemase